MLSLVRNIPGIAIHISLTQLIYSYLTEKHNQSISVLMPYNFLKTRVEVNTSK